MTSLNRLLPGKVISRYLVLVFLFVGLLPVWGRTPPARLAPADVELASAGLLICLPVATETVAASPIQGRLYGASRLHRVLVPVDPVEAYGEKVYPALLKNVTVRDSLRLRKIALNIKREVLHKAMSREAFTSKFSPEQIKELKTFVSAHVNSPLPILAKPLAGMEKTGNAASRTPNMIRDGSGKNLSWAPNSMWLIGDLAANLENDTLSIVFGHENAHIIMFEMYGAAYRNFLRASSNGHMAPYITDQGLALIEGWAEAFEAVYGPANPRLSDRDRKKFNIPEFRFERQDPVRRERYIWARYFGKKTGVLKTANQMMATEGVIAGLFYDILTSRALNAVFEKCARTMLSFHPLDFPAFIRGYLQLFPEDRKVLTRIILENTRYVTMHREARAKYFRYYQANLAKHQNRPGGEDFPAARSDFHHFKEELYQKALNGTDMFANVGPELWFTGKTKSNRFAIRKGWNLPTTEADRLKEREWEFNLDLNTVTESMLTVVGFSPEDARKITDERNRLGFFTGKPFPVMEKIVGASAFNAVVTTSAIRDYHEALAADKEKSERRALWPEAFLQGIDD